MGATLSMLRHGLDQSFNIPSPPLTEKNLPDQHGKVFLITGANAGVGYEVARILYQANGTVYLGCRTESKAQAAISAIKSAHPNSTGKLIYLHLDLGDLTTIKATANDFLSRESRLDWLDNNAGVMVPPRGSKTTQAHELQLGTNVLGPFLLTKLLSPILRSTAALPDTEASSVRVSWAGSMAINAMSPRQGVQFDPQGDIVDHNGGDAAYGASKVANWWLAHEFGRRSGTRDGVLHNAYNPGNLKSDLQRHLSWVAGRVLEYALLFPAVMGAYTEIWAGLGRELTVERDQGVCVIPWGRRSVWNREDVVKEMGEGGNSERLWEWCERETREFA